MNKYIEVSQEYLLPQLHAQTNQNFDWFIMGNKAHYDYLESRFDYPFEMIQDREELERRMKEYNIQTRHDIDDWMSVDYVRMIQTTYKQVIGSYARFIIHAQPVQLNIVENKEFEMRQYRSNNTSMFVSLCQKEVKYNIFSKRHNQLWRIGEKTFKLKGTPVKWIIHGNNITCKRK
jgi:hypothetical protein